MAIQMFLVQPKDDSDDQARASIAEFIVARGGFVLMATSSGSLIAAFDDQHLGEVKSNCLVDFVGGVSLDPQGKAAQQLQQLFARNIAMQLGGRSPAAPPPGAAPQSGSLPPGYRPLDLKWRGDKTGS